MFSMPTVLRTLSPTRQTKYAPYQVFGFVDGQRANIIVRLIKIVDGRLFDVRAIARVYDRDSSESTKVHNQFVQLISIMNILFMDLKLSSFVRPLIDIQIAIGAVAKLCGGRRLLQFLPELVDFCQFKRTH